MHGMGVIDFTSERKRVENLPDYKILGHVIQEGLQGFTVEKYRRLVNRGKRSQSHFVEMGLLPNYSKFYQRFHRTQPFKRHLKPSHR